LCASFVKKIDEYLHMVIHMIVSTLQTVPINV